MNQKKLRRCEAGAMTKKYSVPVAMLALPLLTNAAAVRAQPVAKPNVLLIMVDDLRPDLGCYGNSIIKTPHLDALAARGRVFTRHYANVPTCGQ